MSLKYCIKDIIEGFDVGVCFDSHTMINELISNKDSYLEYLKEFPNNCTVAQYHGQIAKCIGSLDSVKQVNDRCISQTIFGDLEPNMLWEKVY